MLHDTTEFTPKYVQIAQRIRAILEREGYRAGDQIPTERDLAHRLGVAYLTVRRANQELIKQGIIRREHGRGSFLIGPAPTDSAKSAGGQQSVGFLVVGGEMVGTTLEHFRQLRQCLKDRGYNLIFDTIVPHVEQGPLPSSFAAQDLAAVVVHGALEPGYLRQLEAIRRFPIIISGNAPAAPELSSVELDFFDYGYDLTRIMAEQVRCDYVWLVIEPLRLYYTRDIIAGYRRGLRDAGVPAERLSICDVGDPYPFIQSFAHERKVQSIRHGVIWHYREPFPSLALFGENLSPRELQVVNGGPRTDGWTLPAEFDLGSLVHSPEVQAETMADVVVRAIQQGSAGAPIKELVRAKLTLNEARQIEASWIRSAGQPAGTAAET